MQVMLAALEGIDCDKIWERQQHILYSDLPFCFT